VSKGDPDLVARQAYEALQRGERRVVGGGVLSKVGAVVNTALPDGVKSRMQEILSRPPAGRPGRDGRSGS
jgi:uncharacterized protein